MVSNNLRPWIVIPEDFYNLTTTQERLEFFIRFAVLAPSSHNTQPWRFKVASSRIEVYADYSRRLSRSDESGRMLYMACGCAIENIIIAADHYGFAPSIAHDERLAAEPSDHIATITFQEGREKQFPAALFEAITQRVSYRKKYQTKPVPEEFIKELTGSSTATHLDIVVPATEKMLLASIAGEAMKRKMSQRPFRWELAQWLRTNITRQNDGMPGSGHGMSLLVSLVAPFILRFIDVSGVEKKKAVRRVINFPAVGIISTKEDTALYWVLAGQLLERLWLAVHSASMAASVMAAPVEDASSRERLEEFLSVRRGNKLWPQIVFGFGFPETGAPHSPRRNIKEVLI